jgi:HEPN domain-containing protein
MRPAEEQARRKIVADWIHKAEADVASAETLLSRDPPLLSPACFHAQQAAEKYLKAYLTSRQVESPRTHSIRELLNLAAQIDPDLSSRLTTAAALTVYGVEIRYPGEAPEPDLEETRKAVELARAVRDAVLGRLESC